MGFLTKMWTTRTLRSQRQVGERTARVVERVIFDLGVDNLVQGMIGLDRRCRPRFSSGTIVPGRDGIAVALDRLAECAALSAAVRAGCGAAELQARTAALVAGLLREFHARSAPFRALPAAPAIVAASAADPAEAPAAWSFE